MVIQVGSTALKPALRNYSVLELEASQPNQTKEVPVEKVELGVES